VEWVEKRLTIKPEWAAEMGLDNSSGRNPEQSYRVPPLVKKKKDPSKS
jgi:hypothetical protein